MTVRLPLVLGPNGLPQQLKSGDILSGAAGLFTVCVWDFYPPGGYVNSAPRNLASVFGSLAAAQAVYPWVDDLTPQVDYCAIQSAIDYAFNNNKVVITMPEGGYNTSAPIYLDGPTSLRNQGAYPRWTPGATFTLNQIVTYNGIPWVSLQNGNTGHAPFFAMCDQGTGVTTPTGTWWRHYYSLSSGGVSPLAQQQAWNPILMGSPSQSGAYSVYGTVVKPQFINDSGVIMGPNNGGTCKHITVFFPFQYVGAGQAWVGIPLFGGNDPNGIGIAVAATGAGASRTVIEDCWVINAYTAFYLGAFTGALGDSNVLKRCGCTYCYMFATTGYQSYINEFYDCNFSSPIGLGPLRQCSVFGGNYSSEAAGSNGVYTCGSTTAFSVGSGTGYWPMGAAPVGLPAAQYLNISTTISSFNKNLASHSYADSRAGVFNLFMIVTPSFGIVPFVVVPPSAFNVSTGVLKLMVHPIWYDTFLGTVAPATLIASELETEIRAQTKIYATCVLYPFQTGVQVYGGHIENPGFTCLSTSQSLGPSKFEGVYFDQDPTMSDFDPSVYPGEPDSVKANFYAAQCVPFIAASSDVILDNIYWGTTSRGCLNIYSPTNAFKVDHRDNQVQSTSNSSIAFNLWFSAVGPLAFKFGTEGFPFTLQNLWKSNCTLSWPPTGGGSAGAPRAWDVGDGGSPMQGLRPAIWSIPSILSEDFATLANPQTLPALTATGPSTVNLLYPFMYGGTTYQTSYPSPGLYKGNHPTNPQGSILFESSHDFLSYHQSLTVANIPGLSWSARGQSWVVYLDATTIQMMKPPLVIGLTTATDGAHASATNYYMVTGVYPGMGYITVYNIANANDVVHSYVTGANTVYTGTTITSQPYRIRIISALPFKATAAYTAIAGQTIMADTFGAAFTVTLPINPVDGDTVTIRDARKTWNTNNLTIAGNGNNIDGAGANLVKNTAGATVVLVYNLAATSWESFGA